MLYLSNIYIYMYIYTIFISCQHHMQRSVMYDAPEGTALHSTTLCSVKTMTTASTKRMLGNQTERLRQAELVPAGARQAEWPW